jgi:glyoxylase-like metal-dependent hydrolase (beta-lactamase superfamily II)
MEETMFITRRRLVATGAAAGALATLAPKLAWSAASMALGDAKVDIVSDGHLMLPVSMVLGRVPEEDRAEWLKANAGDDGMVKSPLNLTLFRDGERTVLFDVGSGPNFMASAGKIKDALDAIGVAPDEVTNVVFTHAHPDHIWGVKDDFDEIVFANAEYAMSEAEWDYWFNPETVNTIAAERQSFAVGARNAMEAIEDKISRFKPGSEVLPGIEAFDTSGHTPGHTSFVIHKGSDSLVVVGDVITNAQFSFSHPEWETGTDSDPQQGVVARKALLDRLATDKSHMIGYHLPHPGTGRVERTSAGYTFAAD